MVRLYVTVFCEPKTFLALQKKSTFQDNVVKNLDGETMKIWLKFCETGFFKDIICQPYYAIIFFVIEFKWLVKETNFKLITYQ